MLPPLGKGESAQEEIPPGAAYAAAAFAAIILASSWDLTIFFLYLILLLPNQLQTYCGNNENAISICYTRNALI